MTKLTDADGREFDSVEEYVAHRRRVLAEEAQREREAAAERSTGADTRSDTVPAKDTVPDYVERVIRRHLDELS